MALIAQWSNLRHPGYAIRRAAEVADRPRRHALPERKPPRVHLLSRRLSKETLRQIVNDYLAGKASREIAEHHGISKGKVIDLVREAGHDPRPRGPVPGLS